MPPDLALLSTLIGSNYPSLELIFMVPKVFEPLKFDCNWIFTVIIIKRDSLLVRCGNASERRREMANSVGHDQTAPLGAV